jgi:hypothetical protein
VHEGEVGDVEEVVGQQARRGSCPQRRELADHERGVVGLGNGAERGDRLFGRDEHHAVGLGRARGRLEVCRWRQGRPRPQGRDLDAAARAVEAPAVVGALEHAFVVAAAEREPGLAEQHHVERLPCDLGRAGHRVPAAAQGAVGVGEEAAHGATLLSARPRRQGAGHENCPVARYRSWDLGP